jgi:hypothetical protein
MPVLLLDEAAALTWLRGSQPDALALQRPANDDVLEVLPLEEKTALNEGRCHDLEQYELPRSSPVNGLAVLLLREPSLPRSE